MTITSAAVYTAQGQLIRTVPVDENGKLADSMLALPGEMIAMIDENGRPWVMTMPETRTSPQPEG